MNQKTEQPSSVEALAARALEIPMQASQRERFAGDFNDLPAMRHFGARLVLDHECLVRVDLDEVETHHRGGLGTHAVNGAVIAGLFDCALGVAGVLQLPGKRTGTVELSIKLLRPVVGDEVEIFGAAIKRSKQIVFAESELFSGGRLCALATGIVAVASSRDWAAVP